MDDKIPGFKEEIDEIHVPIDKLDTIISTTVQQNKPKRMIPMRKKLVYTASAAAIAFGLLVGSASVSPVMANIVSHIPLIGSIFSDSDDRGLNQVSDLGLTQTVGTSKTIKGDTVTIDEVFYDGTRFTVSYSLESEKPLKEYYFENGSPDFTINGEHFDYGAGLSNNDVTPTYRTGIFDIDVLTELPEAFDFEMIFEGPNNRQWNFNIPVKMQTEVEVVKIDHTQQSEDVTLFVSDLKISPAGLRFNFNAVANTGLFETGNIDFHIEDQSGNEIESHSGASSMVSENGKDHQSGGRLFDPISHDVKKLIVTPYIIHATDGGGVEFSADGKEIEIPFKPYTGKEIKFESFEVLVPTSS